MSIKFFDPAVFRQNFPALVNGSSIYLDSAATALKPDAVIQAIHQRYSGMASTVHRSQHAAARSLTLNFEQTRHQVAEFINAPNATDIVWTQGATEAINLVAQSYARPRLKPGDEIIVSEAEHHANLIPWLIVARQTGARVIRLPLGADSLPDLDKLPALFTDRTRLLALGQMSNVTGGRPDLVRATEFAHRHNCVVVIDGAQGIVHCPVDVTMMDIDFYAFSAHKLYGPDSVGVLYGRADLLADMPPWQGGGKMLTQASFDDFIPEAVPYRFEAGTPNIAGVTGFSAVLAWLAGIDLIAAEHYSQELAQRAQEKLSTLPGFRSFRCPRFQYSSL
jgi:cysteine sulfinate desulfinase